MKILKLRSSKQKNRIGEFDKYWVQKIPYIRMHNRFEYFKDFCNDKNVLHFGCVDWPIFDSQNNLHIELSKITKLLHGFDIDIDGLENLKKYVNQNYYSQFSELKDIFYDVCLVPETIEHVDNVSDFLQGLSGVNANKFIITAPNCFSGEHISRNYDDGLFFYEVVHPDHNCWYSPFTLKNQIEKYSNLKVTRIVLLEDDKMIACEAEKK